MNMHKKARLTPKADFWGKCKLFRFVPDSDIRPI